MITKDILGDDLNMHMATGVTFAKASWSGSDMGMHLGDLDSRRTVVWVKTGDAYSLMYRDGAPEKAPRLLQHLGEQRAKR